MKSNLSEVKKMKRVHAAIFILVALLVVTLASSWLVKDTTETLLAALNLIEEQCTSGNYEAAQEGIGQLNEYYQKREHILALFIKRDYLGNISVCLGGLNAYIHKDNAQDLKSELGKARAQIEVVNHLFFSMF